MLFSLPLSVVLALQLGNVLSYAVKPYESLAGLSRDEVDAYARSIKVVGGQPFPGAIKDTRSKLVNDHAHPWKPLEHGQQRGPCPGLNTLASHGWLPRSGVVTPGQIVEAVQNGFNLEWKRAILVTYAAFLVNGNPLTNLMSIGGISRLTGPAPPPPALASGLNTHATFEGDASMSRSDDFLGDNHSFNETLFEQIVDISNKVGGGKYNLSAAAEVRFQRYTHSLQNNPTFEFANPRFFTAFVETIFPVLLFVDGRATPLELDLDDMRGFFQHSRMPHDFHRREGASDAGGDELDFVMDAHDYQPGRNNGSVNSFVVDPNYMGRQNHTLCALYEKFVNTTMELYPNPHGELRKALNVNLDNFYFPVSSQCDQLQPYP